MSAITSESTESLIAKDIAEFASNRETLAKWSENLDCEDLDWLCGEITVMSHCASNFFAFVL